MPLVIINPGIFCRMKIYINKDTWSAQKKLVPGSVLVLSFVQKPNSCFGYDYLCTSRFSAVSISSKYQKLFLNNLKMLVNSIN